ncbi:phospholipase [Variovorax sp. J22G21]|uniref:phospholipase n=1 Tax=Variovorax fucosicus TaxID=3053517 RepID=UPI002577DC82|nr:MULTISPECIES: phospholipase [unclassified Variovorax]MDM0041168.1 phospholipase [Variovorax sp. J22R193]MDM0060225.1 phospholipase [Variovorax sp. J22G21]
MKALRIYAGPLAREHIARHGLQPQHVRTIPGAAGGPKGLILGPIDRFLFGEWLPQSTQPIHLVGASIGAWRLANACLNDAKTAFEQFEHGYIHQHFEVPEGQKRMTARQVSVQFGEGLRGFYGGRAAEVLGHPRFRLHVIASRGRHILGREGRVRTPVGYLGAFATNSVHRRSLGAWLERVVFSSPGAALPFGTSDFRTRQVALQEANFAPALQASCSIPFMLEAVHDIPGAPPGAYWDGGITDYHLHLDYDNADGIVLYPHFQKAVVPGWLDKGLKWRHRPTGFLNRMVVLAPDPEWIRTLPNGKLPDRNDFIRFANDAGARISAWGRATREAQRLADELAQRLQSNDIGEILPL